MPDSAATHRMVQWVGELRTAAGICVMPRPLDRLTPRSRTDWELTRTGGRCLRCWLRTRWGPMPINR